MARKHEGDRSGPDDGRGNADGHGAGGAGGRRREGLRGADDGDPNGADVDEPVPRLPRSLGFKLSTAAIVRILMTAALLVMLLVAQRPCADSVSEFVTDFDKVGSGAPAGQPGDQMPKPGRIDVAPTVETGSAGDYETLRSDMTEEQLKAAIDRAKARAAGSNGSAPRDGGKPGSNGSALRDGSTGAAGSNGSAPRDGEKPEASSTGSDAGANGAGR